FAERVSEHGLFVGGVEEPRPVRTAHGAAGVLVAVELRVVRRPVKHVIAVLGEHVCDERPDLYGVEGGEVSFPGGREEYADQLGRAEPGVEGNAESVDAVPAGGGGSSAARCPGGAAVFCRLVH